jgi:putative heme-binding domain-containing protein
LAKFLQDSDELIVTEAALAIHDDFSVPAALPALADLATSSNFQNEPLMRRVISANQRVGEVKNLNNLLVYSSKTDIPLPLKKEAIAAIGTWAKPSVLDRVDGRYRGVVERDPGIVREVSKESLLAQLNSPEEEIRLESAKAMGKLAFIGTEKELLVKLKTDPSVAVKVQALMSLNTMNSALVSEAINYAMSDNREDLRVAGLSMLSETSLPKEQKVKLLTDIIQKRTIAEKQTALLTLGGLPDSKSLKEWDLILADFQKGKLPEGTWIELEEAITSTNSPELKTKFAMLLDEKAGRVEWKKYSGALAEGSVRTGRNIFFQNQTAQCIRCHAYDDMGGNAGPRINGVGNKLSREELLIALVDPSARLSPGFGMVTIEMNSGEKLTGTMISESKTEVTVKVGAEPEKQIAKSEIKTSKMAASSMPPMGTILSKRELRDLVTFLMTLTTEE